MNEATLERLMMDAALGALNEDVRELLMAHLAGDESKARHAEELRALVNQARDAMKEKCPAQPGLQVAQRRSRLDQTVKWGGRIVAMAACLLVGFGIARLRPARQVQVIVREKPANLPVLAVNDVKPAPEGELWSAQRIYRNAMEVNRNDKPRLETKRIFQ